MEWKVIKESVAANEVVCDSFTEVPIEYDMLLPDYCPDIMKILKCCALPVFTQTTAEGGTLTAEGYVQLNLYYLTEGMQLRCCESRAPFSKTSDLKCTPENPAVTVFGHMEYLNCRAISPRRVDVRGAMTMGTKVIAQKEEELVADAAGGGIQLRRSAVESMCLVGTAQRSFTVREELELSQGKPAVGVLVRKAASACVTECKVIPGKVIMKGDLTLEILYLSSEDEAPETMRYTLPVSQIADIPGAEEGCVCDVRLHVTACDVQPKADLDGETTMLSAEVTLCMNVHCYRAVETSAVSDAYSTSSEATYTQRQMNTMRLVSQMEGEHAYREQMELPEGATQVLELWCEAVCTGCRPEGAEAKLCVRLNICMIALDSENNPAYFEKPVELEHGITLQDGQDNLYANVQAQAGPSEFSVLGGGIEVRCSIRLIGVVFAVEKNTVMSELNVDESKPRTADEAAALTIYFAQAGECVWDIAKRYQTAVSAVMEENAIEQETLPARTTLLIPMVV